MAPAKWVRWWGCCWVGVITTLTSLLITEINGDVIVELREGRRPFRIYEDQPARFGDALPPDGLSGWVVVAEPLHGCQPIRPPPADIVLPPAYYWIAIIQRSVAGSAHECTFQEKVMNAQAANYSGAIVFNNKDDELIPMGGDAEVLIPSVFIGRSDADKIIEHYTYKDDEYVVRLTENAPFDINAYLLPFAIVVGICFVIMLGVMVFKCIQDRRRERRHRLPKSSLNKIPTKKFVAGDEEHYETCCICLDDYVVGDKLRILPCDHAYHVKCIDPWLLKNKRVCPQCRKKVFASGEVPPSDSESETEDERAPLLARNRRVPAGTFSTQRENPFRRAARRLARTARQPEPIDNRARSPSGRSDTSSSTEEGGAGAVGQDGHQPNQLLAEVRVEPAREESSPPPALTLSVNLRESDIEEEEEKEEEEGEDQVPDHVVSGSSPSGAGGREGGPHTVQL